MSISKGPPNGCSTSCLCRLRLCAILSYLSGNFLGKSVETSLRCCFRWVSGLFPTLLLWCQTERGRICFQRKSTFSTINDSLHIQQVEAMKATYGKILKFQRGPRMDALQVVYVDFAMDAVNKKLANLRGRDFFFW